MPRPCKDVQRFFRDVAPGTTLTVSVDGPDGSCVVLWNLFGPGLDEPSGNLSCPGRQVTDPLPEGNASYGLLVTTRFLADATITLGLQVGDRAPVRCDIVGNQGDISKWLWFVLTA